MVAIEDRFALQDTISRFGRLVDDRNWVGLSQVFAERVKLDYTRLFGGEPEELPGSTLGERWHARLGGLDATQHIITNVVSEIDGDMASVVANVIGVHFLSKLGNNQLLTGGGVYHMHLKRADRRWLINELALRVIWLDGNRDIFTAAAENSPE